MAGGWEYGPTGHTGADPATGQQYQLRYIYDALGNLKSWTWAPVSTAAAPIPAPAGVAATTGVNPVETSYSLYGHNIPLSVFGVGRIGGDIISGPWIDNGTASFIISFGVPADPYGSRDLREIAFDSEVVWTAAGGFSTEPFTFRFYPGTLTQAADPLETSHFGADAVAYRPQILIAFDRLPLAGTKFKKIPYVAALFGDSTGDDVNLGEAFERLAYSPWVGWTSAQFETVNITDGLVHGGLIIVEPAEFLATIQQFGRFYSNWDIIQTDKLRIVDRGSNVTADITLDKTRLMGDVGFSRAEPNSVPRELELTTIDPDADYTLVPSTAKRPRDPVAVTSSVKVDTAYLPAIMDASLRQAIATFALYHEEVTRKRLGLTAMLYGLEIEPGDLIAVTGLGIDFHDEVFKVTTTTHGNNYSVEIQAEALLRCTLGLADPHFGQVILLAGFDDGADGSTYAADFSPLHRGPGTFTHAATVDSAQARFGNSLQCPGADTFPTHADGAWWPNSAILSWYLGTIWTIECFAKFNSLRTDQAVLSTWVGVGTSSGNSWELDLLASGVLRFFIYDGVSANKINLSSPASTIATGPWYHLAVDCDGTRIRMYVNGVMVASGIPVGTTACGNPIIGATLGANGLISSAFSGWIDEARLTAGICRYGSNAGFTPPGEPFPRF